jgi:hypothetical protein
VRAAWKLERKTKRALVKVTPFEALSRAQSTELRREAERLGDVAGLKAELVVET